MFGLIAYGCYELCQNENAHKTEMTAKKGMQGPREIPVVAVAAHSGDMPVYLEGLGTVTAFQSVTVKPRVDGQLISVNFREGQEVRQGELLAQLDPRPFQVVLDQAKGSLAQAKGNLAKDEAALRDAEANYVRDQELFKQQIIAKQQLDTQLASADQIRGSIEADNAAIEAAQATINSAQLNLSTRASPRLSPAALVCAKSTPATSSTLQTLTGLPSSRNCNPSLSSSPFQKTIAACARQTRPWR